jgi:excisionase family DNA binding protein
MNLEALLEAASERGAARAVDDLLTRALSALGGSIIRADDDTVLTLEEAAAFLRLDAKTVKVLLESRGIAGRKCGAQWRIPKWGLRRYLDPNLLRLEPLEHAAD